MDLAALLKDRKVHLTLLDKVEIANSIACGMRYLHYDCGPLAPIIHNDLKPHNVLVNLEYGKPKDVKVCDFGIANTCQITSTLYVRHTGRHNPICGSPLWWAPEVCEALISGEAAMDPPKTKEVDVYAFGVLLFEVITQEPPFGSTPNMRFLHRKILEGARPDAKGWLKQQPQKEGKGSGSGEAGELGEKEVKGMKQLVDLMEVCWAAEPDKRPSFKTIAAELEQMIKQLEA